MRADLASGRRLGIVPVNDFQRQAVARDVRILELHLHPLDLDVLHLIYLGRHPGNSLPDSLLGLVWDVAVTCLEAPTPCGGARDRDTASLP